MAVTTGTTTGTTSSSKPSSGGPTSGGSLQAPNRTDPSTGKAPSSSSTGQGGQGSSSSGTAAPSSSSSSSSSGTSDQSTASNTSTSSTEPNTTTVTKSEPTDQSLRSPTEQAKINQQEQSYFDYGGAYTTPDPPPSLPSQSKESVKVTDPARNTSTESKSSPQTVAGGKTDNTAAQPTSAPGKTDSQAQTATAKPTTTPTAPSATDTAWAGDLVNPAKPAPGKTSQPGAPVNPSGTSTAWQNSTVKTPQAAPKPTPTVAELSGQQSIAQDPAIAGMNQQANQNYAVSQGPGGMVSRSYSDPDLSPASGGSFIDSLVGSVPDYGAGMAPGFSYQNPTTQTGMGVGAPQTTVSATYPGPTQVSAPGTFEANASIFGIQPTGPSVSQAIAQDPITYGVGPRIGAPAPAALPSTAVRGTPLNEADLANRVAAANQGLTMSPYGTTPGLVAKDMSRIAPTNPTVTPGGRPTMASPDLGAVIASNLAMDPTGIHNAAFNNPNVNLPGFASTQLGQPMAAPSVAPSPSVADPRDLQRQEQFNQIAAARGQVGKVVDAPVSVPGDPIQPGPTGIPAPQSMGMMAPTGYSFPQFNPPSGAAPAYPGQDGLTPADMGGFFDNGAVPSPMASEGVIGQEYVNSAVPTGQPVMASPATGMVQFSDVANPASDYEDIIGTNRGTPQLGQYGNVGQPYDNSGQFAAITGTQPTDTKITDQVPSETPTVAPAPSLPSQEGELPAQPNPAQYDGQPQSLSELENRYKYEKGQVKQGIKDLPGDLIKAITTGDIHGYTPTTNDKQQILSRSGVHPGSPADAAALAAQAALINRLIMAARQQQAGYAPNQMDLVFNTFV